MAIIKQKELTRIYGKTFLELQNQIPTGKNLVGKFFYCLEFSEDPIVLYVFVVIPNHYTFNRYMDDIQNGVYLTGTEYFYLNN